MSNGSFAPPRVHSVFKHHAIAIRRRTMSNGSFAPPRVQSVFKHHAISMQSACNQATHREQWLFRVPPRCNLSVEDAARRNDAQ
jgi:hypothetical protein